MMQWPTIVSRSWGYFKTLGFFLFSRNVTNKEMTPSDVISLK